MNYLLICSAAVLGWTTMHIIATERERQITERTAREAHAAARRRASAEAPIVVR